jgi:hypothetical protein
MRFEAVLAQAEIASWVGAISTSSATIVGLGIAVWENSMTVISVSAHASTSVTTSGTVIRGHLHGEARLVRSPDHFWEAGSAQRMVGQMCASRCAPCTKVAPMVGGSRVAASTGCGERRTAMS